MSIRNTFCWVDIPVVNLDRAKTFYQHVLDTPIEKISEHGFEFVLLPHIEDNVSGCLTEFSDRQPSQHGPLVYLNVDGRLDHAIAAVQQHGGQILKVKEAIGPYGHRAIILDTEGNAIALYSKAA